MSGRGKSRRSLDLIDAAYTILQEIQPLSPVILRERVQRAIVERLDQAAWDRAEVTEAAERESLASILSTWPGISGQASKYEDRA